MVQNRFLKIDGIDGESQSRSHLHEIEVLSWNWKIETNTSGTATGGASTGRPIVSGVTFTHYIDKASTKLFRNCVAGTHIQRAVLSIQSDRTNNLDYFKITLDDVIIGSVLLSDILDGSQPIETVTMVFAKVTEEYTLMSATGSAGERLSTIYNVRTNQIT